MSVSKQEKDERARETPCYLYGNPDKYFNDKFRDVSPQTTIMTSQSISRMYLNSLGTHGCLIVICSRSVGWSRSKSAFNSEDVRRHKEPEALNSATS